MLVAGWWSHDGGGSQMWVEFGWRASVGSGRVLLLAGQDLEGWRSASIESHRPSKLPYGVELLEDFGLHLEWSQRTWRGPVEKALLVAEHRSGVPIRQAVESWNMARSAGCVIALLEQYVWAAAFLKRHHVGFCLPTFALSCWIAERALRADAESQSRMRRRYDGVDLIFVWSTNQIAILEETLDLGNDRVVAVPYGVDADFYQTNDVGQEGKVVAIGNDVGRDYGTLFKAAAGAAFEVDVVSVPDRVKDIECPPNVRTNPPVDHIGYRNWLQAAQIVVIPVHPLAYPTGQSVLLEAMAMGRCCITTDTDAIREYVTEETVAVVPPHDPVALREMILTLLASADDRRKMGEAARAAVLDSFTTRHMWDAVAQRIRPYLGS